MIYSMETYLDDDRLPVIEKAKICEEKVTLNNPELIFNFLNKYLRLGKRTEEYVYLICFDTKSHPLGLFEISHGTVNSAVLSPREIYMKALLCGAANIVMVHNHPSGDVSPSQVDMNAMERIKSVGELLSLLLMDFIICGDISYFSAKKQSIL